MTTWNPRANELFLNARELGSSGERGEYLDRACAGDVALRVEVDALLKASDKAGTFLQSRAPGITADEPTIVERPGTIIGPYKLLEQIGEGGMGVVFMAEQLQPLRRKVALKVLKPGMDTRQVIVRFEAERQALAIMDHPNIARVFDGGATDSGRPYFVMELVKGETITTYCDRNHLGVRQRLELFVSVCQAVQHAHHKGIVHRDLKPANVLITVHDTTPVVKVIDFGVAKALGQELTDKTLFTGFAQMIGTPLYMSPEQAGASGLDVDTRTDIYSLGVLLYELLTGTTPFAKDRIRAAGVDEVRRIIQEEEPARPSMRASTLGAAAVTICANRGSDPKHLSGLIRGELDWVVMKALEKDRNRRYQSPNLLAADVQRYLDDEPVQACPPSVRYRLGKYLRRNRVPVVVGSVASVALFGGLLGVAYGSIEAAKKREVAGLYDQAVVAQQTAEAARREAQDARERLAAEEYGRTMQVAYQECLEHNVPAALALLNRTRPEFRGWEWWYVRRLCHSETLTIHPDAGGAIGTISSTAFSPDGNRVMIGFANYAAVLDATTGLPLLVLKGHTAGVKSAQFNRQGTRIVTGSHDGTAKVWDARTGAELLTLKWRVGAVLSVSFSPDGGRVLTAGDDNCARVWDVNTGAELVTCVGHTSKVNSAAFSRDGTRIVTASQDETAIVWDAKTGDRQLTFEGHTNSLTATSFSPDGTRVVTASYDRTARVWDAKTGKLVLTFQGHTDDVYSAAFSPDGSKIVTGSWDLTARVWDAKSGVEFLTLTGHTDGVTSASFSPDGSRILTGCHGLEAKVWHAGRKAGGVTFRGHTYCVHAAAISPDGLRIVSMGLDKAPRLEDTPETMVVWGATTGVVTAAYKGSGAEFQGAAFSPDGALIVTACRDGTARVWDSRTGDEVLILRGHNKGLTTGAFSPDGSRIITASYDRTVRLWDAKTGAELRMLRGHTETALTAVFSPDGSRIITAGYDHTARVWDAMTGAEIACMRHTSGVRSAAFSPDGARVVTGCSDRAARVWDLRTGAEVLVLNGHTKTVHQVAFSPDGTRIITGSEDRTVRLWDTTTGAEVLTLKGHTHGIDSAAFSPDGVRIVTAGHDAVRVWDLSPPPPIRANGPTN